MLLAKIGLGPKTGKYWHLLEDDREETRSPAIINDCLARLKSRRVLLTLLHNGYESGSTILIGYDRQHLEIGRPVDWPSTSTRVRVLFKDKGKLWNYFTVEVDGATDDSLLVRIPKAIYRLQRRAHFRVDPPRGSEACFMHKGTAYANLSINDLSAGGMQVYSKTKLPLFPKDKIAGISLFFPGDNTLPKLSESPGFVLQIRHGRIVRAIKAESMFCYGIIFDYSQDEEKLLLRYVRHRELELLRKGLMNGQ